MASMVNYDHPLTEEEQKCYLAILEIRPMALYKIGDTYESLQWDDTEQKKPTKAEFDKALADFKEKYDARQYRRDRIALNEYPSIEEISLALADKEEGDSTAWDKIKAQRKAVKDKYPKP